MGEKISLGEEDKLPSAWGVARAGHQQQVHTGGTPSAFHQHSRAANTPQRSSLQLWPALGPMLQAERWCREDPKVLPLCWAAFSLMQNYSEATLFHSPCAFFPPCVTYKWLLHFIARVSKAGEGPRILSSLSFLVRAAQSLTQRHTLNYFAK